MMQNCLKQTLGTQKKMGIRGISAWHPPRPPPRTKNTSDHVGSLMSKKSLPYPKIIQNHEACLTGSLGSLASTLGSTIQHGPVYSPWNGEDMGSTKHGWCCFKENKTGAGFANSRCVCCSILELYIPNKSEQTTFTNETFILISFWKEVSRNASFELWKKKWGLWIWHITSPKLRSRAADPRSTLAEICWKGKFDVRVFNHLTILASLLKNSSHIVPFNSSYMFCPGMQETTTTATATTNSPKPTYPRPFNPSSLRNQAPCPLSRLSWPSFASHKKGRRDYFR